MANADDLLTVIDRIRAQHGNVIVGDFKPRHTLELPVSVDTLYADTHVVLLRCRVGNIVWHMLGDASGKVIST